MPPIEWAKNQRERKHTRGGGINEKGMRRKKNKELLFWVRKHSTEFPQLSLGDKMLCHDLMVKNMASGIR